jgi:hypothetical protein
MRHEYVTSKPYLVQTVARIHELVQDLHHHHYDQQQQKQQQTSDGFDQ